MEAKQAKMDAEKQLEIFKKSTKDEVERLRAKNAELEESIKLKDQM